MHYKRPIAEPRTIGAEFILLNIVALLWLRHSLAARRSSCLSQLLLSAQHAEFLVDTQQIYWAMMGAQYLGNHERADTNLRAAPRAKAATGSLNAEQQDCVGAPPSNDAGRIDNKAITWPVGAPQTHQAWARRSHILKNVGITPTRSKQHGSFAW